MTFNKRAALIAYVAEWGFLPPIETVSFWNQAHGQRVVDEHKDGYILSGGWLVNRKACDGTYRAEHLTDEIYESILLHTPLNTRGF